MDFLFRFNRKKNQGLIGAFTKKKTLGAYHFGKII